MLDGHFGTNNVMQMVRQSLSLHLISKLRHDAALYFLYEGSQKPAGRKRVYGAKIDYDAMARSKSICAKLVKNQNENIYKLDSIFLYAT